MFHEPSTTLSAAADRLAALGIATVSRSSFVVCADPKERDFQFVRDRTCRGRIVLRVGADEAGDDYSCPACHRTVHPTRNGKRVRPMLRVAVKAEGVLAYVRNDLARLGKDVRDLAAGVFRIDAGAMGVVVCVVEYCDAETYVSQQWASIAPTCYVTVDPAHAAEGFLATWTTKAVLAEVVSGAVDLPAIVNRLAEDGAPKGVVPASPRVYARPVAPVSLGATPAVAPTARRFVVEVGARTVRVDDVEVVAPQATARFDVFHILWALFLADLKDGKSPEEFRRLRFREIVAAMEERAGGKIADTTVVRRALNRMQEDVAEAVKRKTGAAIGREDIVEIERQAGQTDKEHGYRINPRTVCARPYQPPAP